MPKKKSLKPRPARSVPDVGNRGSRDSESSSSSSISTRSSSTLSIKQFKKAQLAEKKAMENASRLSGESTAKTPRHLVSHMLPYFFPNDYPNTCDDSTNDKSAAVPPHLVSHVNTVCYPKTGTVDDENVSDPRTDVEVPLHLVSHVNAICYPETCTIDDEDVREPRPDIVPRHLETHVGLYCQPVDDDGTVLDWPSDTIDIDESPQPKPVKQRRVPKHLMSQVEFDESKTNAKIKHRPAIRCDMTRDHPNSRDSVFDDLKEKPFTRRVGGRRPVANRRDLFEESKPKLPPMSITIVQRAPENTKENIFGSNKQAAGTRKRWEHDTMKTVYCREEEDASENETATPRTRSSKYEDTTEKLFGEKYGIDEAAAEYERRRRPAREDTQATLFGPPKETTPQRQQSALSFTTTHDNLFGSLLPQSGRRTLVRENTFDNLFGGTPTRSATSNTTSERYTTKNPKILQDHMTQVLNMDCPLPPERRMRKAVYPVEAFNCKAALVLSPITHEHFSVTSQSPGAGACDTHWTPALTQCRRRQLSLWDTTNTITGEALPYAVPEDWTQQREAWIGGKFQDAVAPPPSTQDTLNTDKGIKV